MIPILYERTETDFTTNGLGRLSDAISCTCEQERNGTFELTIVYPLTGLHYKDLAEKRIILAIPDNFSEPQQFQIYKITRPMNGQVTVYAEHISYKLSGMVCMPFEVNSVVNALSMLYTECSVPCPFTFTTDKTTVANFKLEEPKSIRSILGGDEDSILEVFGGGDYEFNNYRVILHHEWGVDNGVTLRYGKNITDITKETDSSETFSGLVPYWKGTDDDDNEIFISLSDPVVWAENASAIHDRAIPYDMSDAFENEEGDTVQPTEALLKQAAQEIINDSEAWKIKSNITVSFAQLWQTEEYKDFLQFERVRICDTVHVIYDALDIETTMRVIRTDFDVINERYNSIELGDEKDNLNKEINGNIKSALDQVEDDLKNTADKLRKGIDDAKNEALIEMHEAIDEGTKKITGGYGGYVVLKLNANEKPEEILVMDNEDINRATYVWRFNKNGIGFSNVGYNGPYQQAWTIDGKFYTDWVVAGRMTANLIKVGLLKAANETSDNYWDMLSGDFKMRSRSSNKGITFISGVLNIDADVITAGILKSNDSATDPNFNLNLNTGDLTMKKGSISLGKNANRATGYNFTVNNSGNMTAYTAKIGLKETLMDGASGAYIGTDGVSIGRIVYSTANPNSPTMPAFWCKNNGYARVWGLRFVDLTSSGSVTEKGGFQTDDQGRIQTGYGMKMGGNGTDTYVYNMLHATLSGDSDLRIKDDVSDILPEDAINFVKNAKPVTFKYKDKGKYTDGVHHGLIAQEVRDIAPGHWSLVNESDEGILGISYIEIIADLLAVSKELLKQNEELKERIGRIENEL